MWKVYKELHCLVDITLRESLETNVQKFEASLKEHKNDFMNLMKNPAKSATDKDVVLAGNEKGIKTGRSDRVVFLTSEMINEAITLSELFDLNEIVSVDLLLTAESEQYFFPGLSRGLVAVLIYFQSKLNLALSLQLLCQGREGRAWEVHGSSVLLNDVVNKFITQLVNAGLVANILSLFDVFNETSQLTRLQLPQFLAIGPPRHKFKVTELIRQLNAALGSCLFYLSCQSGLSKTDTLLLIGTLANIEQPESDNVCLTDNHLAILMSLLYSFDLKILTEQHDEDWSSRLPLVSDACFHKEVTKMLTSTTWKNTGLQGVVSLAWSLALIQLSNYQAVEDKSEWLVDKAIECNVFAYIKTSILSNPCFFQEQYYVRRIHNLVTDLIINMPLKVKEIRSCSEEVNSIEDSTVLSQSFVHLLNMIGALYKYDPLNLELSLELWCPNDPIDSVADQSFRTSVMSQRRVTLFKFIRLAGDMLSPSLYTAYINMLTGLSSNRQSAHCCFNLLKINAMSTGSQSSIISWDHFFSALQNYYTSLKNEDTQSTEQSSYHPLNQTTINQSMQINQQMLSTPFHFQPHHLQSTPFDNQQQPHFSPVFTHRRNVISDDDVEGLIAVLHLISTVVEQDQDARAVLTESNRGQTLFTIFGLITCSIPLALKGALLTCLASFSKSPNVAADMWLLMEKAQVLYMVGRNGNISPRGLHIEINEMEPQTEEYSLTRSFVALLNVLTSHPLSSSLVSGLVPFVNFLKDFILLKAFSRSYKKTAEKWQVSALCLEVVHRLIDSYDVVLSLLDEEASTDKYKNDPRIQLLTMFYMENNLLKLILSIIDQTSKALNKHFPHEERSWMDKASLWCLKLLHTALQKQTPFLENARKLGILEVGSTGTDTLLLAVNPRTLKSDHVLNLTRFFLNHWNLPHHALHVTHILSHLASSTYALPKVVSLLSSNQNHLRLLMASVAECIDCEDAEENVNCQEMLCEEENLSELKVRLETRKVLMEMLLNSMVLSSSHHMAFLLCAFDVLKPIHKTQIQDPGINHFPRTLLHSLVNHLSSTEPPMHLLTTSPSFSLMAYKFIYYLASDPQSHSSVLRFLRSHDFLYKQAVSFPKDAGPDGAFLPHLSWLIRTLVVDLKVSASKKQRSYVQKIVDLFTKPGDVANDSSNIAVENTSNHFSSRIIKIIRLLQLNPSGPKPCHLSILHQDMAEKVADACEVLKEKDLKLVDVQLLYKHLIKQCNTLGANLASQKERAFKETEMFCSSVTERNQHRRTLHACKDSFISIKQLVEVILNACPQDCFSNEDRQLFIVALLQTILHKVSTEVPSMQLTSPISELILTLCCQLNRSFSLHSFNQPTINPSSIHLSQDVSVLTTPSDDPQARNILSSSLQSILSSILTFLLSSASSNFRVRTYLYGAVWYCLNISHEPSCFKRIDSLGKDMQKYLSEKNEPYEKFSRETMTTISMVAPQLLSALCKDSCDGQAVSKMLSMTVLDCLLSCNTDDTWLDEAASKGFIHHLVTSLLEDNKQLQTIINKNDNASLRAFFIFESKIALLCQISLTPHGANILLSDDLMGILSQLTVIDAKLNINHHKRLHTEGDFTPSMLSSYRQKILFPILNLILSLLTSLGANNVMALEKIFPFVMSHYELLISILSDYHSQLTMESLQELQLVSALVSKTALDVAIEGSLFMDAIYGEVKVCTNKLQKLMGALLGRLSLGEIQRGGTVRRIALEYLKETCGSMNSGYGDSGTIGKTASKLLIAETKVMIVIEEIIANSLSLSQSIIAKPNAKNAAVSVLFAPSISDAIIQQNRSDNDYNLPNYNMPQSMGVLVQLIMDACSAFSRSFKQQQDTLHRHSHVSELSVEEVKELLEDEAWTEKLPLHQRHNFLRHKLLLLLRDKSKELKLFKFIIESSLMLLWRHLDFYLVKCESAQFSLLQSKHSYGQIESSLTQSGINDSLFGNRMLGDSLMGGNMVPKEHLNALKRDCIAWINEAFFKALIDVEVMEKRKDGFIGALVRKVKRIITFNASQK